MRLNEALESRKAGLANSDGCRLSPGRYPGCRRSLRPWGVELPMSVGAIAMNSSTIIVAVNAPVASPIQVATRNSLSKRSLRVSWAKPRTDYAGRQGENGCPAETIPRGCKVGGAMKAWKAFVLALLLVFLVAALGAALFIHRGFRATNQPSRLEATLARAARDFSIPNGARRERDPLDF